MNKHTPTVYARREPTLDEVVLQYGPQDERELRKAKWKDVVIYHDPCCRQVYCRFAARHISNPDRRNKWITLNCCRYRLVRINDLDQHPLPVLVELAEKAMQRAAAIV